ncbi:hypothetical protein F4778DRAFT_697825 [Xylariomycetidae sp. FL2044]|nr:hypothetical protein F4778DRAFT_802550 [Xylariomycetidae sp. FL2044]KAH9905211.1 hypothetical protein F4778DRAFT_697825 [Xylariomycetidae sp. FL2044]
MSLLRLPAEILTQIMDGVGSSYFREDLGRLTICRQWFSFARTACFKDLQLCQKSLRSLLSSQDVGKSLLLISDSVETLDLELEGLGNGSSARGPQSYSQDANVPDNSNFDGNLEHALSAARAVLDNDMAQLAIMAKRSRRLRTIRMQTLGGYCPLLPRCGYLSVATIRALLSVQNLTVLELDLCGTSLMPQEGHSDDFHVCTSIGALLTTLRRLRLRMRSICADALRPQHHETSLRLSEVLINLSLSNESTMTTSMTHSTPCSSTGGRFLKLKADIEDQAEALATRMISPKIVRVLTHSLPQLEMRSLDILSGKCMILADDMAWEDDGKTEEDCSDSESDILDDDFSTSSNEEP